MAGADASEATATAVKLAAVQRAVKQLDSEVAYAVEIMSSLQSRHSAEEVQNSTLSTVMTAAEAAVQAATLRAPASGGLSLLSPRQLWL